MKILESFCDLVDDIAYVYIFEYVLGDDVMEICLNELKDEVNIFIIFCFDGII